VPKSLQKYQRREREFAKKYNSQLDAWAVQRYEDLASEQEKDQPVGDHIKCDTNLYKEREDPFPIVANKILQLAAQHQRPYHNKTNLKMIQESFDPIRIRLRVIPISKAPLAQGMNPDFYFVEAGKKALGGDLTSALDYLKRGLAINPAHYLCTFNHAVLLFKFGLITEAAMSFYNLTKTNPKEAWPNYNLAICLLCMGLPQTVAPPRKFSKDDLSQLNANQRYEMIGPLCQQAIEHSSD
jgi:tetratricopeptide (TPR) repeat protein